jgi:glycine/D-amino acid oxidase-like deaminating enzyme
VKEYPFWWDTVAKSADGNRKTRLPDRADVLVIGAGYTGLSAARQLAASGASTLVVDRHEVGWGASSRNGGQVLTGLKLEPTALLRIFGERRARELFEASTEAIARLEALIRVEEIDCGFERCGHLLAAWKPEHFKAFRIEQELLARVFAHRVELVTKDQQRCEMGTDRYHGLLLDQHSGSLNPALYVRGLAAAAQRAGACIVAGTAVQRIQKNGFRWRAETSAGTVEVSDVMVATNGYTDRAVPDLQRRLVPVGSYIIATEPLSESDATRLLPRRRMAFDSKYFLYYFRLTSDHRLLFGGRAEFTPPTDESTRRAADVLRAGMIKIFPELAAAKIEYAWGGNLAFTRDQMPHAGRLNGLYFAGGYCGHGIALATMLGELVARRISGESMTHPLIDAECPAIPLYSGTPWFLPLVGAYYKVKDWIT